MHTTNTILSYRMPEMKYRTHFRSTAVRQVYGEKADRYIARFVDVGCHSTEVLATSTVFNIKAMNGKAIRSFVNLKRVNDIENVNEFFAAVNQKLPYSGLYIGCVETIAQRKQRKLNKYPVVISYPLYLFDFILKRLFPKWGPTKRIYQILTRGNNRVMSITETLGRLVACGFTIEDYTEANNLTYFVARKKERPRETSDASYGAFIRLRRVGKNGRLFNVYKFRTMHPYAEYLQDFVHKNNNIDNGGKFKNDFRITSWGRVMRKLWLDEQPMWINWFRGDLKLVGVRPLSVHYFGLYPPEFQKHRIKYTPGLIPPYYVDMPETLEEIIASEKKYLDAYDKHPWLTDARYFFRAVFNIVIKRARSG